MDFIRIGFVNHFISAWTFIAAFFPGKGIAIIKLYYCKRLDSYVTYPGHHLSRSRRMAITSWFWHKLLLGLFATVAACAILAFTFSASMSNANQVPFHW